jgi:endonuclease/exonuclease/phosphatase family metal-dependent hydrolase
MHWIHLVLVPLCLLVPSSLRLVEAGNDDQDVREAAATAAIEDLSVVTFNIRYGTASDGKNAWPNRRSAVIGHIDDCQADFIGLQECLAFQTEEIRSAVGDRYEMIVRTRQVDDGEGEATPLLFLRDRWVLDPDQHGTFWLSEQPETPGSISWNSSLPRIATWGRFHERSTGRVVWVLNTHFDHRSEAAREGAAHLIARRLGDLVPKGEMVIVLGDLNAVPGSAPLRALQSGAGSNPVKLIDAWHELNPTEELECTMNEWGEGLKGRRIDFVLVTSGAVLIESSINRPRIDGRPISDHWPVHARISFTTKTEP